MEEYFLTYEQSLALKELGFNQPCLDKYDPRFEKLSSDKETWTQEHYPETLMISAPLKSQFFKWVRHKHEHNTEIVWMTAIDFGYSARVKSKLGTAHIGGYGTYEEAEDACINKIIELLKLK